MALRLLICGLLLVGACKRGEGEDSEKGAEPPAVRVVAIERGGIERTVQGTATVESERAVEVIAEATGRVVAVPVEEGDSVKAGQLLCAIENPRAQVALERAKVELQQMDRELEKTAHLNERGYVARSSRDELEFRRRQAELEVRRAQEEVRALRVTAPFAGVVARRRATVGEVVAPQRALFSLVDDKNLIAVLHVPEAQARGLSPGLEASARFVASGLRVRAEVLRLAPVIDAQSGTQRVTLRLPPGDESKPGMLVEVRLVVERREQALLVPQRALDLDALQPALYRLGAGGDGGTEIVVERLHPALGIRDGDQVEIVAGLEEGDRVVIAGQSALRDGIQVRVVEWARAQGTVNDGGGKP